MYCAALQAFGTVVRNRPLNERQVFMALTHTNNWITEHIHMLSFSHCSSLREAVKADIKEARPTVRRKPPVQQLKTDKPLCGLYRKCIESVPKYCGSKGSGNVSQLGCYKYPAARSVV